MASFARGGNFSVLHWSREASLSLAAPITDTHPPSQSSSPISGSGYEIGTFYVNWAIYGRQHFVTDLHASKLTKVNYAFANINNVTGELFKLKQQHRYLRTVLSVGGWSYRGNFKSGLATPQSRQRFAESAVALVKDLGLDGFDVDWEYPEDGTDARNLVDAVWRLRELLDTYSEKYAEGYRFEITISAPAGPERFTVFPVAELDAYVDEWNLMSFDYVGPGFSNFTGHLSNIYPSALSPHTTPFSTLPTLTYYKSLLPAHKIILGLPAYDRSYANVSVSSSSSSSSPHSMGSYFCGPGTGSWESGVLDFKALPLPNSTVFTSRELVASWSYDAANREGWKAEYVMKEGLGGAWWWDSSSDRKEGTGSLLDTVEGKLRAGGMGRKAKNNCFKYPVSRYGNVRAGGRGE
ncbi:glycoside hydrolase superfamily [Clohesyomyces aquaticus]|uniref:chitinase n=1 Tax=Clohesyomyces aquaticus TaxID=1231657 RepID=A0A1Y2A520_9PLEO|nr:glycoside hydrolase superfamily [Clohesyomyces aquaticus]